MCGNTDRWGIETQRTLYFPGSAAWQSVLNTTGVPADLAPGGAGYTASTPYSCGDPNFKLCQEELWDRVKVYHPEMDIRRPTGSALDTVARNQVIKAPDNISERAIQERNLGYDPPANWRTEEGAPVGSFFVTNLAVPDREYGGSGSGVVEEQPIIARTSEGTIKQGEVYEGYDLSGIGQPSGSAPPPGVPSGGLNGANCNKNASWSDAGGPMATSVGACPFTPVLGSVFYSPTDIMNKEWPQAINRSSFPEGQKLIQGGACTVPSTSTLATCIDAPSCFVASGNECESYGKACDGSGYKRKLGDTSHPFNTANSNDSQYRNTGYSNDYVVDYLYYVDGFLSPQNVTSAFNRANRWTRNMLEFPPVQWLSRLKTDFAWIIEPFKRADHVTQKNGRVIWRRAGPGEDFTGINSQVAANIQPGHTVAILVSDIYYRGHAGIVTGINGNCVSMASANWLYNNNGCQQFDPHNCYQIYGSFGTPCVASCIPLDSIALMWNPILQENIGPTGE